MDESNHTIQLDNFSVPHSRKENRNSTDLSNSKNVLIEDEKDIVKPRCCLLKMIAGRDLDLSINFGASNIIFDDNSDQDLHYNQLSYISLISTYTGNQEGNILSRSILTVRRFLQRTIKNNTNIIRLLFLTLVNFCLLAYLVAAIVHWYNDGEGKLDWCRGNGMIVIIYIFLAWLFIYYKVLKPYLFIHIQRSWISYNATSARAIRIVKIIKRVAVCLVILGIVTFLVIDSSNSRIRLVSAGGVVVFIILGFLFSKHPNKVNWKTVIMGVFLQILFGLLVIRWDPGRVILMCVGNRVETFLQFGYKGAAFVYGDYIINTLAVFAFQSLSVIFFLSAVIEICFYFGWMQIICFKFGWFIQNILGTTIIESVNAVTTVFLGLSEAPLLYKPYIKDLTSSEMHAVMAGGFSTAAGTVFAAYAALGANPAYIITASIMAAPAALCFAKLLYPETEQSKTSVETFVPYKSEERNVVDAACKGALSGINLVMGIIAIVIACISMVAFLDSALVYFASIIGIEDFTFEYAVGKILIPIPYIMGVRPDQCEYIARLIGIKITLNEFIAYKELGKLKKAHLLTPRSEAMATFALCSFSNPGGLGSFIALLVGLCPSQKEVVTTVAVRALLSGITTGLMTASIAGALMPEEGFGHCLNCTIISTNSSLHST